LEFLAFLSHPAAWLSLLTLTALEIVLGVDNLVFVALATQGLPSEKQALAGRLGLGLAVIFRLALLSSMFWLTRLIAPIFSLYGHGFSGRDVILLLGGLFLLYKATAEIHEEIEPSEDEFESRPIKTMGRAIAQIALLDIVFSLDSVLTAIGMVDDLMIMASAVIIALGIMIWASGPVGRFIKQHPTVKMLALGFLLLIGMTLVVDGCGYPVPKGFIYAAIGFSLLVEALNQWARRNRRAREPKKPG
jgi:predicted tellurium resistance membrane protein TerC